MDIQNTIEHISARPCSVCPYSCTFNCSCDSHECSHIEVICLCHAASPLRQPHALSLLNPIADRHHTSSRHSGAHFGRLYTTRMRICVTRSRRHPSAVMHASCTTSSLRRFCGSYLDRFEPDLPHLSQRRCLASRLSGEASRSQIGPRKHRRFAPRPFYAPYR